MTLGNYRNYIKLFNIPENWLWLMVGDIDVWVKFCGDIIGLTQGLTQSLIYLLMKILIKITKFKVQNLVYLTFLIIF